MEHALAAGVETLRGWFDRDAAPVLTVEPGDSVTIETLDCWWSTGPLPHGQQIQTDLEHRAGSPNPGTR